MTNTPHFISVILTTEEASLDISTHQSLLEYTGDMADASIAGPASSVDGTASPTAVSTNSAQRVERPLPEKWKSGNPKTSGYYDEPAHVGLPPDGMDLSDFWTVRVIKENIPTKDRPKRWPAVFSSKYLSSKYQTKGSPSKQCEVQNGKYFYDVIFGRQDSRTCSGYC